MSTSEFRGDQAAANDKSLTILRSVLLSAKAGFRLQKMNIPWRVAAITAAIALIAWLETVRAIPNFRLLTFVLIFVAVSIAASMTSGRRRDWLIVCASLAFGLSSLEGLAILLEPKIPLVVYRWMTSQPVLGWTPARSGRYHAEARDPNTGSLIYSTDYTIDHNLLRQTLSAGEGRAAVLVGDSYTFGVGLNDADALPQIFADLTERKQRVLNLGFPGYGPQHFLRELETGIFDRVIGEHPRAFIFTTFASHAERSACKPHWMRLGPYYGIENGGLTFLGPCYSGAHLWVTEWLNNTALYRVFIAPYRQRVSREDFDLYIETIAAAVRAAKQKYDAPTLIAYIRTSDHYFRGTGFSDDKIIGRLREAGANVIDVSLEQQRAEGVILDIPGDGHPTAAANRARARLLMDSLGLPRSPSAALSTESPGNQ